jgi:hypothetical protein
MIKTDTHYFYPADDKKSVITIHRIEGREHGKATCFKLEGSDLNEHERQFDTWGQMAKALDARFKGKFSEQFPGAEQIKFNKGE